MGMEKNDHINRREFVKIGASAGALLATAGQAAARPAEQKKRPNLVFVFSDQQSYDMLGCYGNRQIITPNVDRFAEQSLRFTHCISPYPVCTPFRSMLFSGQHTLHNGAVFNDFQMRPGHGNYLAECLTRGGYQTGYIGKWHLYGGDHNRPIPPGPLRYGFDDTFISNNCTLEFDAGKAYYWNEAGEKVIYNQWEPTAQVRQASEFIKNRSSRKPFALFLSMHPPHDAGKGKYPAPEELKALYEKDDLELRPDLRDKPEGLRKIAREMLYGYMAMCSGVDRAFGELMKTLEEEGLAENTIVVYTSDHGDCLRSNHRQIAKGFIEDPSVRVPLLIRWPGQIHAGTSSMLFSALDFMPTLLSMLNLSVPQTCQGHDLSNAVLSGSTEGTPDAVPMFHVGNGLMAWRGLYTAQYSYSFGTEPLRPLWGSNPAWNANCLYDRIEDPAQQTNRYDDPELRGVKAELFERTARLSMDKYGDRFVPGYLVERTVLGVPLTLDRNSFARALYEKEGIPLGRPVDLIRNIPGVFDSYCIGKDSG